MDQNQESKLTQMKESVQKLGSSIEYGDPTLKRFLIARSIDPSKAAKMFVQWQKWRASFVPLGFFPDTEVSDELDARKVYLQGLSNQGYPVLIIKTSKHFSEFVVHVLDKSIGSSFKGREIGDEKLVVILDLQQISYKNMDARAFITSFQFLQAYYPERLAKVFILDMPWYFVGFWRMVTSFVDKATKDKFVNVSSEDERREFIREVGKDVLPEEYGGNAKLVPLQDVVLTPLDG